MYIEIHDELNPKLWDSDTLKEKIRNGVLKVVAEFVKYIEYPELPIIDIILVGSNTSYNYTDNSDIDVHLIINFEQIDENKELVNKLFQCYKTQFNTSYNIDFCGLSVELYCEDIKTTVESNGIYSIIENKWIKYPQHIEINSDINIEDSVIPVKVELENAYNSNDPEYIQEAINWLYLQRQRGIQTNGEFSLGNLIFKEIRNTGLLDKLKDKIRELKSKELCVEQLNKELLYEDIQHIDNVPQFLKGLKDLVWCDGVIEQIDSIKNTKLKDAVCRDVKLLNDVDIRFATRQGRPITDYNGLYEIKTSNSTNEYRVFYSIVQSKKLIMHSCIKKDEKGSHKDYDKAIMIRNQWIKSHK